MATETGIGCRIRTRRNELKFSIRELARRTGLSASFISQVERGKTNISLSTLRSVAEQLDSSIHYFFSEPVSEIPPRDDTNREETTTGSGDFSPVVRAGRRPKLYFPESGFKYELLITDLTRHMEAIYGRLTPSAGNVARPLRKPTEELIYVLSGTLLVGLEDKEYFLFPGDSIYFEGEDLTRLECAPDEVEVKWISIITPSVF